MKATYRVRVARPPIAVAGGPPLTETRDIEADNVAVMGPFLVFQQEKPLRALPGQPPPTAVVYTVSAENLVDVEEVSAAVDPQVPELHPDGSVHVPGDHP